MPLTNQYLEAAFGSAFTGLATVGYALKDNTGGDVVARTTTGVFEQADGTYGVVVPTVADTVATIEWDTGGATPVYAHEDVGSVLRRVVEHVDVDISSRSDFDETTDPVELLDSGGTAGTSAAELVTDIETDLAANHGSGQWDATAIAADIADAVWRELVVDHASQSGSFAELMDFMRSIEGGRQEITDDGGGTLTCYAADNTTVIATFLLYDSNGARTTGLNQFGDASRPVAERVRS